MADLKLEDPKSQTQRSPPAITDQFLTFRSRLRSLNFITEPAHQCKHTSLKGVVLDDELVNFCKLAREKRAKFFELFLMHGSDPAHSTIPFNESLVFITLQERAEFVHISN